MCWRRGILICGILTRSSADTASSLRGRVSNLAAGLLRATGRAGLRQPPESRDMACRGNVDIQHIVAAFAAAVGAAGFERGAVAHPGDAEFFQYGMSIGTFPDPPGISIDDMNGAGGRGQLVKFKPLFEDCRGIRRMDGAVIAAMPD